jgi:fatty-acyl-CoA synthase/long-chain acyl-CoA synthetase
MPVLLSYTGGTTGKPKCVVHTQGRLAINLLAHLSCGEIGPNEVMLLTTPLPHSAGYHMQACLFAGGHVVLAQRFDPVAIPEICNRHQVTWTFAVPTMLYRLIDALSGQTEPLPSLRTIVYGAAPMSQERIEQALDLFGPVFIQLYGQTECPNYITTLGKADHLDPHLLRSCGRPVPFCTVEILGEGDTPAGIGEVGEITASSPYLFVEYLNNPEQTAKTLIGGRLQTGDLAYRDRDGFLFLVDRAKDMIITGGMNVYSVEVETAIRQHEAIEDVAVIGIPDGDWGEAVTAVVVSNTEISSRDLKAFLSNRLSAYKLPKNVRRVSALPLTPYGKIDKKALRKAYGPGSEIDSSGTVTNN